MTDLAKCVIIHSVADLELREQDLGSRPVLMRDWTTVTGTVRCFPHRRLVPILSSNPGSSRRSGGMRNAAPLRAVAGRLRLAVDWLACAAFSEM